MKKLHARYRMHFAKLILELC